MHSSAGSSALSFDQLAKIQSESTGTAQPIYTGQEQYREITTAAISSYSAPLTPLSSSSSSLHGVNTATAVFTPASEESTDTRGFISKDYFASIGTSGNNPPQNFTLPQSAKAVMNHPSYLTQSPTHMTNAPSYPTQTPTASDMSQYSQYSQHSSMPGSAGSYTQPGYGYYGGVTSPQSASQPSSASMNSQLAPLPLMNLNHGPHTTYNSSGTHHQGYHQDLQRQQQQQQQQHFDSSGQIPPPGVKPRVTATLWEDEGSLCFQVEAKGVCVARREDNHFINGTKLLNVAGMTRGRRDGILKSEKTRHVVKIGPMHLKGVWIPYERALDFANREKITELLYPLFVHNISALLYHPGGTTPGRSASTMDAARRKDSRSMPGAMGASSAPSSAGLHHHHNMNGQLSTQSPHSIAPHQQAANRPEMNRAHTFPTPPTSASAILPPQPNSYDWGSQSMSGSVSNSQPLTIETSLGNTRSMPSTPATTPPANSLQSMPSYPNSGSYSGAYSATPQTPNQFATQQQNLARFGPPISSHGYVKGEMGPPTRGSTTGEGDHNDLKTEHFSHPSNEHISHGAGEDDGDTEGDYGHRYATGNTFSYTPTSTMGSMHGDHGHLPTDQVETSPQTAGSRGTPRNSVAQSSWNSGYNTPPRTASSVSLNYVMADSRNSLTNGHAVGDAYASNYSMGSTKRGRDDDDDDYKSHSIGDLETLKRRKNNREGSITGAPVGGYDYSRPRSTIIQSSTR